MARVTILVELADRLYAWLRDLADAGSVCPPVAEIGRSLGCSLDKAKTGLYELERSGRIPRVRQSRGLVIIIVETGAQTAPHPYQRQFAEQHGKIAGVRQSHPVIADLNPLARRLYAYLVALDAEDRRPPVNAAIARELASREWRSSVALSRLIALGLVVSDISSTRPGLRRRLRTVAPDDARPPATELAKSRYLNRDHCFRCGVRGDMAARTSRGW